jgi:hypothetical protein
MAMYPDDDVFLGALPAYQLGTLPPGFRMGRRRRRRHRLRDNAMQWASPYAPGVQATDGMLLPMSFPPFTFVAATGLNPITQTANPQTPFRGQRISAQVIRNGTTALATAPILNQLLVGQKPIILTQPGPALETFSQQAYDTNLILPPTYPGMTYQATVSLAAALTTTDTLLAFVSIIGTGVI